jgi:hypothetical protein
VESVRLPGTGVTVAGFLTNTPVFYLRSELHFDCFLSRLSHRSDAAVTPGEMRSVRAELGRHPHQVGEGIGPHLLHDLPAVRFNCDFAAAQLSSNLFVQQTGDYRLHHLPFSGSQRSEAAAEIAHLHFAIQLHTARFEALADCTQQDVIAIERYTPLAKERAASQQDLDKCVHNNHPVPSGVAQPVRLRVPLWPEPGGLQRDRALPQKDTGQFERVVRPA